MADYYVWEGGGDDGGAGTQGDPWATVTYALAQMGADDTMFFKSSVVAYNKPNLGREAYVEVKFVDPASGTDDGNHGNRDAFYAWATVQYALDNMGSTGWVFIKGTETLSSIIDVDVNHTAVIVEGYTTDPRDGGTYYIDGNDAVSHIFQYANTGNGVVLANISFSGSTGYAVGFGVPSPLRIVLWNVTGAAPGGGGDAVFYSEASTTVAMLLFCKTTTAYYGCYGSAAMIALIGCYFEGHEYSVYASQGYVHSHCVFDSPLYGAVDAGAYLTLLLDSTIYNSGGYGIDSAGLVLAINSIIKDVAGNGLQGAGDIVGLNLAVDVTPGGGDAFQSGKLQTSAIFTDDPQLVDPANDDFGIKPTSPYFNGGLAGLHCLTNLAPVGHVLGAYTPRVTHPAAGRLAAVGNPHGVAVF